MATAKKAKKVSRASLMRQYYNGNPNATPVEVAKKFKTSYQVAYMVKRELDKRKLEFANEIGKEQRAGKFKRIAVFSSGKSILNPEITVEEPQSVLDTINPECVKSDPVNHPAHYKVGGIETIDFIEAKGLGYHIGNVVKYITRAGHKGTTNGLEDLKKARWYLDRAIEKNENPK
jgi:hypothetical protein